MLMHALALCHPLAVALLMFPIECPREGTGELGGAACGPFI